MSRTAVRGVLGAVAVVLALVPLAAAGGRLGGWVTAVDRAGGAIEIDGRRVDVRGLRVVGGVPEPGAFVKLSGNRLKVKPQRRPAYDQLVRYPAGTPDNPGRVEFSHLRHFSALGEKQCKTCHAADMSVRVAGERPPASGREPHAAPSRARVCAACHDGVTTASLVGRPGAAGARPIFSTRGPAGPACERCHAPADHGADFTARHGDLAEHAPAARCSACHRRDWTSRDATRLGALLAAEAVLARNPDDAGAALVTGPDNFCVHCHRTDTEWR